MRGRLRYVSSIATSLLVFGFAAQALGQSLTFELIAASEEIFATPHDIVLSPDGETLYVADNGNHRIVVLDSMTLEMRGQLAEGAVAER